jgi:hypothetical protein
MDTHWLLQVSGGFSLLPLLIDSKGESLRELRCSYFALLPNTRDRYPLPRSFASIETPLKLSLLAAYMAVVYLVTYR